MPHTVDSLIILCAEQLYLHAKNTERHAIKIQVIRGHNNEMVEGKGYELTGWLKGFGSDGRMCRWVIMACKRSLSLAS